jgi:hypothetical protein
VLLTTGLEDAWAALSTLAAARGTIAGYTGTARLEALDDDTHTAWLRLQGTGPDGPATATVTVTLAPDPAGTRLTVETPAEQDLVTATLAAALAPAAPPAPPAPPAVAAPIAAAAPVGEAAPVAARRRRLVAAGVVAAGVAVALARRRR